METSVDFIIIGGGSAGCVLANRLSANPAVKVLLLEAGPNDKNLLYRMPAGFFPLMKAGKGNWNFETVPQKTTGGRRLYFPRGKVLGGSSSINGMVVSRGNAGDYDSWAELGNAGWSYAEVLPYFKRLECFSGGDKAYRGDKGPIKVSRTPLDSMNPTAKAWLEGGQQAGHPFIDDVNQANPYGMAQMQGNYADARRQSASACYLEPVIKRPNLTVLTSSLVQRIELQDGRAIGVTFNHKGKTLSILASREVLLAAGVVNSPQILQLSGIGDPADILPHGIAMQHELLGVGKNLQDHLAVAVKQRIKQPVSMLDDLKLHRMLKAGLQYIFFKSGPTTVSALESWAHLKTKADLEFPDLQVYSVPLMYNDHGRDIIPEHGCMAVMNGSRPRSVGSIRIRSKDPTEAPLIDPQYLSDPEDLRVLRDGIRLVREIFAQQAYDSLRGDEYAPGKDAQSDAELDTYIRANANTLYHPVGTCKMGVDDMAVVDPQLRLYGIKGLRVVDASIMPNVCSGNTNFPTMMIAEKAADLILGESH